MNGYYPMYFFRMLRCGNRASSQFDEAYFSPRSDREKKISLIEDE